MLSELRALLDRYADGQVPLSALIADFMRRDFTPDLPPADTYEQQALRELDDPGLIPDGSWLEVEAAYTAGRLSDRDYRVLYDAAAGSARP